MVSAVLAMVDTEGICFFNPLRLNFLGKTVKGTQVSKMHGGYGCYRLYGGDLWFLPLIGHFREKLI